nr:OmpA family protein [Aliikangiella sp. G2MR2-5]
MSFSTLNANASDNESSGLLVSVGYGKYAFDNTIDLLEEEDLILGLGYQINDHWSIELDYTKLDAQSYSLVDTEVEFGSIFGEYRFDKKGDNSWYLRMGLGSYESVPATMDDSALKLGFGYDIALNNKASFVLGTDAHFIDEMSDMNVVGYLGFKYLFGGSSASRSQSPKKAPPVPSKHKDSDNDGISDMQDKCPTTPAGVKVDASGCELDSDKDGVKDSQDQCANTPAGAKVDDKGCRKMLTENVSITLNVKFANNSDVIGDEYANEIGRVASFMRSYPDTSVVIEGHTDSRGAATYNQQLSQKRADAVRQFLISRFDIDASRVKSIGMGEAKPVATNDTAEGRAANRRVQAEIKTTVTKAQ